jgi:hypothetical protein
MICCTVSPDDPGPFGGPQLNHAPSTQPCAIAWPRKVRMDPWAQEDIQ